MCIFAATRICTYKKVIKSFALGQHVLQVAAEFNGLAAGQWEVQAFVQDVGYALAPDRVFVNVTLELEGLYPSNGGPLGGTLLTISGYGIASAVAEEMRSASCYDGHFIVSLKLKISHFA